MPAWTSMVETARENGLKPYDYLMFLFEQLPHLTGSFDSQELEPFMPCSASLPVHCRLQS
ncbi:transposase domain-containing protein [Brevibacillus laterosporus]|uniref:transposase domain-containing protein n=1 Tax=Brevibacillus laterosporus TaxID=1465 RepID=UPI0035A61385